MRSQYNILGSILTAKEVTISKYAGMVQENILKYMENSTTLCNNAWQLGISRQFLFLTQVCFLTLQ
jgi:hypothetical protein